MKSLLRLMKGAGWLNILGMSAAFAAIYIILVQVNYDLGYNKQIKDVDRIFVMRCEESGTALSRPFARRIIDQSACVEKVAITSLWGAIRNPSFTVSIGESENEKEYELVGAEYTRDALDVFDFQPIAGSFEGMATEAKVAVSEEAAKRLQLKAGDVMNCRDKQRTICAIYKEKPENCLVGKVEMVYCDVIEKQDFDEDTNWSYRHFVKLHSAADKEVFEANSIKAVKELLAEELAEDPEEKPSQAEIDDIIESGKIELVPLKDFYFSKYMAVGEHGNKVATYMFLLVAGLILVITLINYVNFFLAQVPLKLRSVNTRKILGSSRTELVFNFMMESGVLVLISLCLASVWVMLFKQTVFIEFLSSSIDFSKHLSVVVYTIAVALIMTLVSSIYPALYTTSFPMALALKGSMGQANGNQTFRYLLVGFQFMVTLVFVICTMLLKHQYDYMMHYDMGFDKENLFTASIPSLDDKQAILTSELEKKAVVKAVTWGDGLIVNSDRNQWGLTIKGKDVEFVYYPVAYNFLDVMGIKVTEGRNFRPSDEQSENGIYIFNEKAKAEFNLTLDDLVRGHRAAVPIAGFCTNFKYRPLHYGEAPFAFYIFGKHTEQTPSHLYIRSKAGATYQEVLQAVKESVVSVVPDYNVEKIEIKFFDEELGAQYKKERKLIQLITLFSILAIVISLMGIIGLLLFETNYRRKEIGIRRVHGAEITEILQMFNMRFFAILLVSFAIASPISYYVIDYYYSTFAYRASIPVWIFLAAFALVLVIMVVVVTLSTYKTAAENPSESLKSE